MIASAPIVELRHLRYFLAVIEELHFGRAARRLHIAQPPLSQAIRRLEDELGVQLLHRTSRVVAPTEAGRVFAAEARNVLAELDTAVAEARRAGGAGSTVRVGCVPHLPMERLQGFLDALHSRNPSTHAEVAHLLTLEQVHRLQRGELDIGIFHEAEDHEGVQMEPLFPGEQLKAVLPAGHRLAGRGALRPADLRDETLVMFPRASNPALQDRVLAAVQRSGYRFSGMRETPGAHRRDVILAVAGGMGIALVPSSLAESGRADTLVARASLDPPVAMPATVVAWPENPPGRLRPVIAAAREIARQLRTGYGSEAPGDVVGTGSGAVSRTTRKRGSG